MDPALSHPYIYGKFIHPCSRVSETVDNLLLFVPDRNVRDAVRRKFLCPLKLSQHLIKHQDTAYGIFALLVCYMMWSGC